MTTVEVGLLCGTLWAATLVSWAIADKAGNEAGDEPHPWLVQIREIYVGFDDTWTGIAIGGLWAFGDGFVSGFTIATIWGWVAG